MKKTIALLLALVMCFTLCACGKSSEVKAVESTIATLTETSSYKDIYDAWAMYDALESKDKEKVKNLQTLNQFCNDDGHFVLTDEMIDKIEYYIDGDWENEVEVVRDSIYGRVDANFRNVMKISQKDWEKCGDMTISSYDQEDDYTYAAYGTIKVADKFGTVTKYNLEVFYFVEYSEEEDSGYTISYDINWRDQETGQLIH